MYDLKEQWCSFSGLHEGGMCLVMVPLPVGGVVLLGTGIMHARVATTDAPAVNVATASKAGKQNTKHVAYLYLLYEMYGQGLPLLLLLLQGRRLERWFPRRNCNNGD